MVRGAVQNVRDHELRGHSMHREETGRILPRKLFVANHPGLYPPWTTWLLRSMNNPMRRFSFRLRKSTG